MSSMSSVHGKRWGRLTLSMVALLAVGACSGGDDAAGYPATEDGLRDAAAAQLQAFIESPGSTYDFLSAECQEQVSRADWGAQMMLAVGFLEGFLGTGLDELRVGEVQVRDVTATTGEAAVQLLDGEGNPLEGEPEFTEFVYEDGSWRSTDCSEFGDGLDGETEGTGPTTTFGGELRPADEVTEEQTRAGAIAGVLGDPAAVGDVTVIVDDIRFGTTSEPGSDDEYTVEVDLRVENRSADEQSTPEVTVTCLDGRAGTWYGDSTFDLYQSLPSGSFSEGTLVLGVPTDCDEPVVRASQFFDDLAADWPVPASAQG